MTDNQQVQADGARITKLSWYRRFWFVFGLLATIALLAKLEPLIATVLAVAFLALIWTGPIGGFGSGLMAKSRKAFITLGMVLFLGWTWLGAVAQAQSLPLDEHDYPLCDSAEMKQAVKQTLNAAPAARTRGFKALEVLNGVSASAHVLPPPRDNETAADAEQREQIADLLRGFCVYDVLTNEGARSVESTFRWIDRTGGRYFIEVR
ncbi:MAG: hypothetical protein WC807_21445 [Hyphomicrobium sp.]|jgi:hypothetical protein